MNKQNKILIFFGVGAILAIITALYIKPSTTTTTTTHEGGSTTSNEGLGGFLVSIGSIFANANWGGSGS